MNIAKGKIIALFVVIFGLAALGIYWFWTHESGWVAKKDFQNKAEERAGYVELKGVYAKELSQIDGLKIWPIDGRGKPMRGKNDWIWVVPPKHDDPTGRGDWDGDWVSYMMIKYGNLSKEQYRAIDLSRSFIRVSGKPLAEDCSVAVDDGTKKCPAVYEVGSLSFSDAGRDASSDQFQADCQRFRWLIVENERLYNESQKMEVRDSNNIIGGKPVLNTYKENNELKDLFYSPKAKSCLYLESRKTLMRKGTDIKTQGGDWTTIYDTWFLVNPSTGDAVMLDDPESGLKIVHRGEIYTPTDQVERILGEYR